MRRGRVLLPRPSQLNSGSRLWCRVRMRLWARAFFLFNASGGQHAPVSDHNDPLQTKAAAQLLHLSGQRLGIAGIALKDLHGYRTALWIGQQTKDDLQVGGTFIAGVTIAPEDNGGLRSRWKSNRKTPLCRARDDGAPTAFQSHPGVAATNPCAPFQIVLARCALAVFVYLPQGGLTDVKICLPLQMFACDFRCCVHASPFLCTTTPCWPATTSNPIAGSMADWPGSLSRSGQLAAASALS